MRRPALVLAGGAAALLAACSSGGSHRVSGSIGDGGSPAGAATGATTSGPASAGGGCTSDVVAQICLTADVHGAVTLRGSGTATAPMPPEADPSWTCNKLADYTNGDTDLGSGSQSVGGHQLQWDLPVPHFHGPGTYSLSGTEFYLNIDNHSYSAVRTEILHSHPTVIVTIDPHFGVRIEFKDLNNLQQGSANRQISGTLRWTCADPQ